MGAVFATERLQRVGPANPASLDEGATSCIMLSRLTVRLAADGRGLSPRTRPLPSGKTGGDRAASPNMVPARVVKRGNQ